MLTAANKVTSKAQEILGTSGGALLVSPENCKVRFFEMSDNLTLVGCRLVGVLLTAGSASASVLIEVETERYLFLKALANWSQLAFLPLPLNCVGRVGVSMMGTGAEAYVYYTDLT